MFPYVRTHTALDFWTPAVIIIILCTALLHFVWKGAVYSLKHKYCHLMRRTRLNLDYSCHVAAIGIWNQKFISWSIMFPIHFTINEGFFFFSRMAGCSPHFLPIYGWITAVHCLRMADLTVMRRKYCRKTEMSISVWLQVCIMAFIMSEDGGCRTCAECKTVCKNRLWLIWSVDCTNSTRSVWGETWIYQQEKKKTFLKTFFSVEESKEVNGALSHCWTLCPSQLIEQLIQHTSQSDSRIGAADKRRRRRDADASLCPCLPACLSVRVQTRAPACTCATPCVPFPTSRLIRKPIKASLFSLWSWGGLRRDGGPVVFPAVSRLVRLA